MSESIIRLHNDATDIIIRTHPFAEIIYWGHIFTITRHWMR